jgi:RNA polymerase sigma-70 factor (sigma-E family)
MRHTSLVGSKGGGAVGADTGWADRVSLDEELDRLLASRGDHLLHAAIALTGNRTDAEDLLQAAVERLLRKRTQIDDLEAYLRRVLFNLAADGWRRRDARNRTPRLLPSQSRAGVEPDPVSRADLRDALMRALRALPAQQRAVVVLRYWEQLTQAETAELLGCSEGAVKSAASRGLARLRELTGPWPDLQAPLADEAGCTKGAP